MKKLDITEIKFTEAIRKELDAGWAQWAENYIRSGYSVETVKHILVDLSVKIKAFAERE